jgi:RIO-like serine/threonine protein kinase
VVQKVKSWYILVCTFFACKIRFSCFKYTLFEQSQLPVLTTIKILDMWLESVPFDLISKVADVIRSAVSEICVRLRSLNAFNRYLVNFTRLGGKDRVVENR